MRVLVIVGCVAMAACGGDSSTAFDLSLPTDLVAPADLAGQPCPPLSSYCNSATPPLFSCQATLSDALARDCLDGGVGIGLPPAMTADCGSYREVLIVDADVSAAFYYDVSTGALVGVYLYSYTGTVSCGGGPPTFQQPSCQPRVALCG